LFAAKANIVPGPGPRRRARGFGVSGGIHPASTCAAVRGAAFWRTAFLAAGRLATHALTSSSLHTRAFGVIKTPGGKPCVSIARFNVIRELNRLAQ
jgi:hypothetical protein